MVDSRFYKNKGPFTLAQISELCDAKLEDNTKSDVKIKEIASLKNAEEGDLCFFLIKRKKHLAQKLKPQHALPHLSWQSL